jgi:hypothetical protein
MFKNSDIVLNMSKKTKKTWFVSTRKSYLPNSWQGLIIYLLYLAYIIWVPIAWYREGHNLWRLLSEVIPLVVGAALLTQYIASKSAKRK